jgi:hypothetical protein
MPAKQYHGMKFGWYSRSDTYLDIKLEGSRVPKLIPAVYQYPVYTRENSTKVYCIVRGTYLGWSVSYQL